MKTSVSDSMETMTENHDAYGRGSDARALALGNARQSMNDNGPNFTAKTALHERLEPGNWHRGVGEGIYEKDY